jgi:hypothetical protein
MYLCMYAYLYVCTSMYGYIYEIIYMMNVCRIMIGDNNNNYHYNNNRMYIT